MSSTVSGIWVCISWARGSVGAVELPDDEHIVFTDTIESLMPRKKV